MFFEKNKSLKILRQEFYHIPTGIDKEYDENGKLIKQINNDNEYKLSLNDLIKKMKEEYKIDLLDTRQTRSVNRNNNEYLVVCNQQARNTFYKYVIDATTGETISIKISDPESNSEKVILDKKAEKDKKQQEDNSYYKTYKGKDYTKKGMGSF